MKDERERESKDELSRTGRTQENVKMWAPAKIGKNVKRLMVEW